MHSRGSCSIACLCLSSYARTDDIKLHNLSMHLSPAGICVSLFCSPLRLSNELYESSKTQSKTFTRPVIVGYKAHKYTTNKTAAGTCLSFRGSYAIQQTINSHSVPKHSKLSRIQLLSTENHIAPLQNCLSNLNSLKTPLT